ncbi:MAG TPA: MFS transporter [Solirubrobacterales bacterium]|nr:MFS transporter [Solirubrobacterales bacterium]
MTPAGALSLLRRRPHFRALWLALALSYSGSGAALVALTLYVQQTHGTGAAVSALLIAETVPQLLGPLVGGIADRLDLRRVMIGADIGQACLFALLALAPPFAALLALSALTSLLRTTYAPARTAAVPHLVPEQELLVANGLTGTAFNLYVAIGPLIGGLLFALGGLTLPLLANAATFLASAWLTRAVPPMLPETPQGGHEGILRGAGTAIRYAAGQPLIRAVTVTFFLAIAFLSIDNVAMVFLVRDTLDGGAFAYGVVAALFGIGMLAGSLAIARGTRVTPAQLYVGSLLLSAVGALLTGWAPAIAAVAAVQMVAGAGNGIEIVASETIYQQQVPRRLLGRVFGLTSTAAALGMVVAIAVGGLLIEVASPRAAFLVSGAGALLVAIGAATVLLRGRSRMIPS